VTTRIPVKPQLLAWALERSRIKEDSARYDKFARWAAGEGKPPTFRQLEEFSSATHAPLGYLFLQEPPEESVPIPDFRTFGNSGVSNPSADLLDTIYEAQQRQDWYASYAKEQGHDPLSFVGSVDVQTDPAAVADEIRRAIDFGMDRRSRFRTWEEALRELIDSIEQLGVLVMVSGIVGSNTHRILDPEEFRGFALTDPLSSLIFVNGADTKSAQIFTLVHELAHIWLGESALSDAQMNATTNNDHELWANRVAAEVLVPAAQVRAEYRDSADLPELQRLARIFKVSTLVVLKRVHDVGFLRWDDYRERYATELARLMDIVSSRPRGGGDYYNTQPLRVSQTFARAVIVDAMEGRTLYRDAFSLLGSAKRSTFEGMAARLGVA
jgi:Zn-dependent peptidase ImmA (M78 family)